MSGEGLRRAQALLDAGFTEDDAAAWQANTQKQMLEGGFSRAEVDTYFGTPPFTADPIVKYFSDNIKATIADAAAPKPVTSFLDAIEAGLQMSSVGLLARGEKPTRILTSDADWMDRMAANATSLAADLPVMGVGALLGGAGGPVTSMAGATALPAGLRKILMDKYEQGEVADFKDFWTRLSGAVVDTAKGWLTGAATAGAGKLAGAIPIASPTTKAAVVMGTELSTMTTVGKALEGEVPSAQDFVDAALVMGFVKLSMHGAQAAQEGVAKLRNIYAHTGVRPADLARDIARDPTIQQDLHSENIEIPKAYSRATPTPSALPALASDQKPTSKPAPAPTPGSLEEAHAKIQSKLSIGAKPPSEPVTFQSLYTDYIDDLNPIREAVKAASKESVTAGAKPLPTNQDPYQLARLTRGSFGKADMFLEHATFDFKSYKNNGESLKSILSPVGNDLTQLRNYAASKRALELNARGITSGLDLAAAQQVVNAHRTTYEPVMRKLVDYQNRLSKYLLDAEVISKDTYEQMTALNKDYIPFFRVMDEGGIGGPSLGAGVSTKNPIKAIKGSERDIVDPLESVIKNTYTYVALAERNAVGNAFVKMATGTGHPEDFIVRVKPDLRPTTLTEPEIRRMFDEFVSYRKETTAQRTETATTSGGATVEPPSKVAKMMEAKLKEALAARGYHEGEANQIIDRVVAAKSGTAGATVEKIVKEIETTTYVPELNVRLPNDVATVFRTVSSPLAENEIAVFEQGKRVVYEVQPDVALAFKSADQETANLLMKIFRVPAATLRAGAVLAPEFIARNALRDQLSALVLSRNGYFPGLDFVRGMISLGKKDQHFENWLKGGGANSTLVSMDRQYLQEHLFHLTGDTGLMSRALNVAKSPLEILRITSELVENATRLGEFRRAMGGAPDPDKARIQQGALASREVTLDFARVGANMRGLNMISAFLNAQVQGVDRIGRELIDAPGATLLKLGVSVTMPSVLLWWANQHDPRYKELPQWQKDLFWIVMTKDTIYRIPKPFEAGIVFGSIPERVLDKYYADNPDAMQHLTQTILDAFTPSLMPTLAAPMVEQFSNKSMFTGNPIIPSRMEKLMPEYQYTEYTTETTKAIGALIGAFPGMTATALDEANRGTVLGGTARALTTPVLIDNYLRSWTGGLGQHLLNLADAGLRKAGVVPDPVLPAKTLADIPFIKAFVVRYPSASADSIQRFYDEYYTKEKVHNTFIAGAKTGDLAMTERAMAYDQTAIGNRAAAIRDALTQQGSLIRAIYKNPDIPAAEKRQLIDQSYFTMIQLAQHGRLIMSAGEESPR